MVKIPKTSREMLEYAAGDLHALHTVIARRPASHGVVTFVCSCGEAYEVAATAENMAALRNVPLVSGK